MLAITYSYQQKEDFINNLCRMPREKRLYVAELTYLCKIKLDNKINYE